MFGQLGGASQTGAKWLVQWCLTAPPIGHQLVPSGAVGVIISKNKILFFVSTKLGLVLQYFNSIKNIKIQKYKKFKNIKTSTNSIVSV